MGYGIGNLRSAQIVMGKGALSQAGEEARRLIAPGKGSNALIVCGNVMGSSESYSRLAESLEAVGIGAVKFSGVEPEPSMETGQRCADALGSGDFGLVVGFGGGSALDVAKVASVTAGSSDIRTLVGIGKVSSKVVPSLVVPTTSGSGSESTMSALLSDAREGGMKKGFVSPFMLPDAAIIDPLTTLSVPPSTTAATGIDALIHALEAFVSRRANPITDALALDAIKRIGGSLRTAFVHGDDVKAREEMSAGSLMAGLCIGNAGLGLVHGMAIPLGGLFNITHGIANAVLLPFVLDFNRMAAPEKYALAAEAMGERVDGLDTAERASLISPAVSKLMDDIGIPASLKELGVPEAALDMLSEHAFNHRRQVDMNPRQPTRAEIRELFQMGWQGR